MRRTLMATAAAMALAVSGPVWAQGTDQPAPGTATGTTTDATTQSSTTSAPMTSEMPATASPLALLAAGGALSILAGAVFTRRRG